MYVDTQEEEEEDCQVMRKKRLSENTRGATPLYVI